MDKNRNAKMQKILDEKFIELFPSQKEREKVAEMNTLDRRQIIKTRLIEDAVRRGLSEADFNSDKAKFFTIKIDGDSLSMKETNKLGRTIDLLEESAMKYKKPEKDKSKLNQKVSQKPNESGIKLRDSYNLYFTFSSELHDLIKNPNISKEDKIKALKDLIKNQLLSQGLSEEEIKSNPSNINIIGTATSAMLFNSKSGEMVDCLSTFYLKYFQNRKSAKEINAMRKQQKAAFLDVLDDPIQLLDDIREVIGKERLLGKDKDGFMKAFKVGEGIYDLTDLEKYEEVQEVASVKEEPKEEPIIIDEPEETKLNLADFKPAFDLYEQFSSPLRVANEHSQNVINSLLEKMQSKIDKTTSKTKGSTVKKKSRRLKNSNSKNFTKKSTTDSVSNKDYVVTEESKMTADVKLAENKQYASKPNPNETVHTTKDSAPITFSTTYSTVIQNYGIDHFDYYMQDTPTVWEEIENKQKTEQPTEETKGKSLHDIVFERMHPTLHRPKSKAFEIKDESDMSEELVANENNAEIELPKEEKVVNEETFNPESPEEKSVINENKSELPKEETTANEEILNSTSPKKGTIVNEKPATPRRSSQFYSNRFAIIDQEIRDEIDENLSFDFEAFKKKKAEEKKLESLKAEKMREEKKKAEETAPTKKENFSYFSNTYASVGMTFTYDSSNQGWYQAATLVNESTPVEKPSKIIKYKDLNVPDILESEGVPKEKQESLIKQSIVREVERKIEKEKVAKAKENIEKEKIENLETLEDVNTFTKH